MSDVHTPDQRHRNMAAIRSRDTKPEIYLRQQLFRRGYRYRIAPGYVPGRPDMFLRKHNVAIFVNGCFWHRHAGCRYTTMPATNTDFWRAKFQANVERDQRTYEQLRHEGVRCLVVWECTIRQMQKDEAFRSRTLKRIDHFMLDDRENFAEL